MCPAGARVCCVPLKHYLKKNFLIKNIFFTSSFYPKKSRLFSESNHFGNYNIYFVRQNWFSRFQEKPIFNFTSPLHISQKNKILMLKFSGFYIHIDVNIWLLHTFYL